MMAKPLSKSDINLIIEMIVAWNSDKITWPAICESVAPLIGKKPTRQSLSMNKDITEAFHNRKKGIKNTQEQLKKPANLKIAAERIANLEKQVFHLTEVNRGFKEKFSIWQYNAYKYGLSEHQLNEELPPINRKH
ncbi:hypothetical protein PagCFBP13505_006540 [Pantoea agglomerans]|uniref:hypothetical protein n=1 Tax=Enterobacter agglomerans TaxID=549 RepID=UPI0010C1D6C7|nr:hypothetical protein [Pantoea agglomerans]TKJ60579.1 hypothetical protein PagCFBP13505_00555 [Pantoea agglomerans]